MFAVHKKYRPLITNAVAIAEEGVYNAIKIFGKYKSNKKRRAVDNMRAFQYPAVLSW